MLKLVEVCKQNLEPYAKEDITASVRYGRKYGFRDVAINPDQIVALYPQDMTDAIESGLFPEDLDSRHEFTRIVMNSNAAGGFSLVVATSISRILSQINKTKKTL